MSLFSVGVLFSDLASSAESPMLERVWPFFLALAGLGALLAIVFAVKGAGRNKPSSPPDHERD